MLLQLSTKVLKNGVKVAIDKDKKLTTIIKKNDLTKEVSDARLDIYSKGNAIDAKIIELDFEKESLDYLLDQRK